MTEYNPVKEMVGFHQSNKGMWKSNEGDFLVCLHPVTNGHFLVYKVSNGTQDQELIWDAFTWKDVLRIIKLERQQDQLALIATRLRHSAEEAKEQGDARRETALLRVLSDLKSVLEGHDISRLGGF